MAVFTPGEVVAVVGPSFVMAELKEEPVAAVSSRVSDAVGVLAEVAVVLVLRFEAASKLSASSASWALAPTAPTASLRRLYSPLSPF